MLMRSIILFAAIAPCAPASHGQSVRVPAEFEPHETTWMQWPRGVEASYRPNFANIIGALQPYETVDILVRSAPERDQAQNFLQSSGIPLANLTFHIMPYNWAWMRDNGPVWVEVNGELVIQDWGFDGWGGIAPPWNLDDAVPCVVAADLGIPCQAHSELIVERGSLEFNGVDTVIASWTVQAARNPGWSMSEMESHFQEAWGVSHVVWLMSAPVEDEFTGGHVDGIARFIDADTVVVARQQPGHDDAWVYDEAASIIEGAGLEVLRLDIPGTVTYQGIAMSANYINWLVANGVVVAPGFGNPAWDAQAQAAIESFFPGRAVHVVECLEIWYWGGGVHCVTNDQPAPTPPACIGDIDHSGSVDSYDLLAVLGAWGPCGQCPADLDGDGAVGPADLLAILAAWGPC